MPLHIDLRHGQGIRRLRVLGGQLSFRFKRDRLIAIASEALPDVRVTLAAAVVSDELARARATAWLQAGDPQASVSAGAVDGPFILPIVVTGQRPQTTVPAQSLYLLNSPYVLKAAEFAAQRLLTERPKSESHRVKLAYERIFNRPPTDTEVEAALTFVKTKPDAVQGWAALCQSLWASHEFLTRS